MQQLDDIELLRNYLDHDSQDAFAALVARHINKVYSVALRHTGNPHQSEEITQSVFVLLARKARRLGRQVVLSGWLYQTARLTAVTYLRSECRRAHREQEAHMQSTLNQSESCAWTHIAPLLDLAMARLGAKDQDAIVLRYFDGKSMKDVGTLLGTTEDAAKKRVNRAMEKLRTFFAKQGVALPATALTAAISANAVQAAPVGLAVTISSAATTTATAIKIIAMTTLQKTLITATLVAAVGGGIYEARHASILRNEVQTLQHRQAPLAEQIQQLIRERDEATNRLASLAGENETLRRKPSEVLKLRGEVARLRADSHDPTGNAAKILLAKVDRLKQKLGQIPDAKIPELDYLTEDDWIEATKGNLENEEDYRRCLARLRNLGESTFASLLHNALVSFLVANQDELPTNLSQLRPYFQTAIRDDVLQRYQILQADKLNYPTEILNMVTGERNWVITQSNPVDREFDWRSAIGVKSLTSVGPGAWVSKFK